MPSEPTVRSSRCDELAILRMGRGQGRERFTRSAREEVDERAEARVTQPGVCREGAKKRDPRAVLCMIEAHLVGVQHQRSLAGALA